MGIHQPSEVEKGTRGRVARTKAQRCRAVGPRNPRGPGTVSRRKWHRRGSEPGRASFQRALDTTLGAQTVLKDSEECGRLSGKDKA